MKAESVDESLVDIESAAGCMLHDQRLGALRGLIELSLQTARASGTRERGGLYSRTG